MIIHIRELREGSNPFPFTIPVDQFDQWVKECDELYFAREGACAVDFSVERFDDLLFVRGTVTGQMGWACATCLQEEPLPLHVKVKWTLVPRASIAGDKLTQKEEVELTSDDLDVSFFDGEEIDLGDLAREAILLELDACPRHDVDACPGRKYLSDPAGPLAEDDRTDPRWAPLMALKDKLGKN